MLSLAELQQASIEYLQDRGGTATIADLTARFLDDRFGEARTRATIRLALAGVPGIMQTPEGYRLAEG